MIRIVLKNSNYLIGLIKEDKFLNVLLHSRSGAIKNSKILEKTFQFLSESANISK